MFDFIQKDWKTQEHWPCLDFANTLDWHASEHPVENLHHYDDLLDWALQKGILAAQEAAEVQQLARQAPGRAAAVYQEAIRLREAIYGIFSQIAAGGAPNAADLASLNQALAAALPHLELAPAGAGFSWKWADDSVALEYPVWVVTLSAAQLLTSEVLDRVGQCADDRGCGWLFFDSSRNRSRRWCDMKDCGNRAKARRFYLRKQKMESTAGTG